MSDTPATPVTITWKPTGPYVIEGAVIVRDNEGSIVEPPPAKVPGQVKLCGCGQSKNRPFCDGSHKR
jgi:CDGSH-type Zn-finger protein